MVGFGGTHTEPSNMHGANKGKRRGRIVTMDKRYGSFEDGTEWGLPLTHATGPDQVITRDTPGLIIYGGMDESSASLGKKFNQGYSHGPTGSTAVRGIQSSRAAREKKGGGGIHMRSKSRAMY